MSHKVIVTKEVLGYLRFGTILHDAVLHDDGWWVGTVIDRASTWNDCAPASICEILDEEKHDPNMWFIRKHFEEKARQERLSPVLSHMCKQLTGE